MSKLQKWWTRAAAMLTALSLAVFVPVAAWAADNEVIVEAAKRRSRGIGGFIGLGSLVCCLVVVGAIVLVVVLLMRRRRK